MSQIEELRQIIIGGSAEELDDLKNRLENVERRTTDVAEVLSPAIDIEFRESGAKLVRSLQKPVSMGLKRAIRAEPKEYAEILYPVMAPSIRRAIAQALSSMMITINRTIESATSVKGIRTRINSFRTGIPYAQLAFRQSLLYRVEHVYLIDRETGMLIDEVSAADSQSLDSDAVSAMFSAIQSFVQDSFSNDASARLTDLRVGDHNVWVAHGPKVMLACVIIGDAPESLKAELYDALDYIRTEYATPLIEFDGDNRDFEGVTGFLEPLLQLQLKDDEVTNSGGVNRVLLGLLAVALLTGFFTYQWFDRSRKVSTVEHYLRQAPGIAATNVYWENDQIVIEGLKDPDAKIPFGSLASNQLNQDKLRFKMIPFRSLEVDMELQRFREEMDLPRGVYLSSRNGRVYLYGEAPIVWLSDNDARIRQLFADRRLDISNLSASFESVSDLLRINFSRDDLKQVRMSSKVEDDLTVVQISGALEAGKLALMRALFAGSNWVNVTARQTVESVEE